MEKVIEAFMKVAGEARDWKCILRYQWVLNAAENDDLDILENLMAMKGKGY